MKVISAPGVLRGCVRTRCGRRARLPAARSICRRAALLPFAERADIVAHGAHLARAVERLDLQLAGDRICRRGPCRCAVSGVTALLDGQKPAVAETCSRRSRRCPSRWRCHRRAAETTTSDKAADSWALGDGDGRAKASAPSKARSLSGVLHDLECAIPAHLLRRECLSSTIWWR